WCVVCGTAQPFLAQADYFRNAIDIGRGGWQNVRREQCRVSVLDDMHDLEETDAFRVEGSTIYLRNPSFSAVYLVEYQPQK
ncbi:MAG: hypothetical protein PHW08_04800, partial [Kiritimatiellae bacterium]|nr:hypothetical protein [Kiritimatiellia bacterium]